ncbi:MAG: altronate dehydratase family protein [Pirellulaceae bacterium]|nr:altronate dehydratase family protein [Pirellulaceae bacterium]
MPSIILLDPDDSVVVATRSFELGESFSVGTREITVRSNVPAGHKIAIVSIDCEQPVRKFGWSIGLATCKIEPGEHVHSHNLRCEHTIDMSTISTEIPKPFAPLDGFTFQGYQRPSGRVGTRNYIAIISNVNCSASVSRMIAKYFDADKLRDYPNVDGVIAFAHEGGCAMAFNGSRHQMLSRVLGGIAKHPNVGGFLLIGLGCEQGTLDHLVESQRLHRIAIPGQEGLADRENDVAVLSIQNAGGTRLTVERGIEMVSEMLPRVNLAKRTTVSASQLMLGTNCGGSDGYSGITANPALGIASDKIVACGGTTILAETTEIYGAEHLLTRRARTRSVAEKLLERMEWWKKYCSNYGETFDNNPSVGNKAGGLTTITEKSLGAVSKGGSTALEAVYEYAEPITQRGFVVMDTPGFDPASVTGIVAGGANLVAFTTGRGSCFGFKPAPSFKIASNSALFRRMPEDMDFNAGEIVEGRSVQEVGHELFLRLLDVASGEPTCSEKLGLGDEEFVPWLVGPVL